MLPSLCASDSAPAASRLDSHRTAMHLAASEGMYDVVVFMLENLGAKHSPIDRWGGTPLDDAQRHKHQQVAEFLLAKGAVEKAEAVDTSASAQVNAAFAGDVGMLSKIHTAGGSLGLANVDRRTALHLAASEGHYDAALFLLECGMDPNPKDRWKGTPLDDAIREGHARIVELLQSRGGESANSAS